MLFASGSRANAEHIVRLFSVPYVFLPHTRRKCSVCQILGLAILTRFVRNYVGIS